MSQHSRISIDIVWILISNDLGSWDVVCLVFVYFDCLEQAEGYSIELGLKLRKFSRKTWKNFNDKSIEILEEFLSGLLLKHLNRYVRWLN